MNVRNLLRRPAGAAQPFAARFELFKWILIVLLFVLAGRGFLLLVRSSPPVMVQALPNGISPYKPSVLHQWIPPTWGWFWRLKEFVLGRTKIVTLNTTVFACNGLSNPVSVALSLKEPLFSDTNGLQVWIVGESDLAPLRRRIEETPGNHLISSPRAVLGDRVGASMFVGGSVPIDGVQRQVGLAAEYLPRVHRGMIDLSTVIAQTGAVTNQAAAAVSLHTNFTVAARIQIPRGSGVFLFKNGPEGTNAHRIGIVLTATVPSPKK